MQFKVKLKESRTQSALDQNIFFEARGHNVHALMAACHAYAAQMNHNVLHVDIYRAKENAASDEPWKKISSQPYTPPLHPKDPRVLYGAAVD